MKRPPFSDPEVSVTLASDTSGGGALNRLFGLPARVLLSLIWVYQRTVSPALPVVFGPSFGCRFAPTCSHYAAEAVRIHGAFLGTWFAFRRLVKCTPLHPGGMDPVPPRRLQCQRIPRTAQTQISSSHSTA